MAFLERLKNGWNLAKTSFRILNENRSLLLFPVFSVISLVLVLATFFGGGFFLVGDQIMQLLESDTSGQILAVAIIFVYYLINFFIIVFFNSALVHCAIKILNEEKTSLGEGVSFAMSKLGKIFSWAVLSATVGTLLQMLHNTGKVGEIVASIIGAGWSILTFFVVPILIYEDRGVFESVKESGKIMKEKWGESLSANVSFGIFHFVGILLGVGVGYLLMFIHPILAIAIGLTIVLLISTIVTAARTIFVAAVYNHLRDRPTSYFDDGILDSIFTQK